MKLFEVLDQRMLRKKAKYQRGLEKSRSLRAKKDKQFDPPDPKTGIEVQ